MLAVNILPALPAGAAGNVLSISVDSKDGSVSYLDTYDGPRIQKIRVLTDANFLEIYWDRYVDEDEAVDISNYVLKNGTTVIPLEAKNADHTNTLYFDKKNKEIIRKTPRSIEPLVFLAIFSPKHSTTKITKPIKNSVIGIYDKARIT